MTPLDEGPTQGSVPDMALMLKEFYDIRGFHENGIPRKDVLEALDLHLLAQLLYSEET
jgi:aldehyde:ferredoxin oxidoreductase